MPYLVVLLAALLMMLPALPTRAESAGPTHATVTIVAEDGLFYLNCGTIDELQPSTGVYLLRDGQRIAEGRVLRVNVVDTIAQLLPSCREIIPLTGDTVVFFAAEPCALSAVMHEMRTAPLVEHAGQVVRYPHNQASLNPLPTVEPDCEMRAAHAGYGLLLLLGGLVLLAE